MMRGIGIFVSMCVEGVRMTGVPRGVIRDLHQWDRVSALVTVRVRKERESFDFERFVLEYQDR